MKAFVSILNVIKGAILAGRSTVGQRHGFVVKESLEVIPACYASVSGRRLMREPQTVWKHNSISDVTCVVYRGVTTLLVHHCV